MSNNLLNVFDLNDSFKGTLNFHFHTADIKIKSIHLINIYQNLSK